MVLVPRLHPGRAVSSRSRRRSSRGERDRLDAGLDRGRRVYAASSSVLRWPRITAQYVKQGCGAAARRPARQGTSPRKDAYMDIKSWLPKRWPRKSAKKAKEAAGAAKYGR